MEMAMDCDTREYCEVKLSYHNLPTKIKIERDCDDADTFDFSSVTNFSEWCSKIKHEGDIDIYLDIDVTQGELAEDKVSPSKTCPEAYNCAHCQFKTAQRSLFKLHLSQVHQACPICKKVFLRRNLKDHIRAIHKKEKPYICYHCGYRATWKDNLKKHISGCHTNKTLSCPKRDCKFSTSWSSSLTDHIVAKHLDDFPYSCPYCEYKAAQSGTMKRHIMAKHTGNKPYKCSQCEFKCCHPTTLKYHLAGKHHRLLKYKCTECNFKTTWRNCLASHRRAAHTNERPYKCPHCRYSSVQSGVLSRHIASKHTEDKPFRCEKCEYSTIRSCLLKNHVARYHAYTHIYACKSCDARFGSALEFRRHKTQNHVLKPLKCRFCSFSTLEKPKLREHSVRKHKSRNLRLCPLCPYFTYNPGDLTKHKAIYHSDSPVEFKCSECNYKAGRQVHLDNHIMTWHTMEKPIPYLKHSNKSVNSLNCKKYSTEKLVQPKNPTEMKLRLRRLSVKPVHSPKENSFRCPKCYFTSTRNTNLLLHMRAKH